MFESALIIIGLLVLILIFLRHWYLYEKISAFGKMVLKKGLKLPGKISKADIEVTVEEMIPDEKEINVKLLSKGDSFYKKAAIALKHGDNKDAEKYFIQCLAMNPSKIDAYFKLAMLYLNNESFSKAELIFRKLIQKINDDPIYLSNLALALYQQEKFDEAKGFYEKVLQIDSSRAGRWYSLANCNHQLGEIELAITNLNKALELDGNNLDYLLTLAHWYVDADKKDEAKGLLMAVIENYPGNEEIKEMMLQL